MLTFIGGTVFFVSLLALIVFGLWFTIEVWSSGVFWGICYHLVPGFAFIWLATHFKDGIKPFLGVFASTFLLAIGAVMAPNVAAKVFFWDSDFQAMAATSEWEDEYDDDWDTSFDEDWSDELADDNEPTAIDQLNSRAQLANALMATNPGATPAPAQPQATPAPAQSVQTVQSAAAAQPAAAATAPAADEAPAEEMAVPPMATDQPPAGATASTPVVTARPADDPTLQTAALPPAQSTAPAVTAPAATASPASPTPAGSAPTLAIPAVGTVSAPVAPPSDTKWRVVQTFSGQQPMQTPLFNITGKHWRVLYQVRTAASGGVVNATAYCTAGEAKGSKRFASGYKLLDVRQSAQEISHVDERGTFFLMINSMGAAWWVQVEESIKAP